MVPRVSACGAPPVIAAGVVWNTIVKIGIDVVAVYFVIAPFGPHIDRFKNAKSRIKRYVDLRISFLIRVIARVVGLVPVERVVVRNVVLQHARRGEIPSP